MDTENLKCRKEKLLGGPQLQRRMKGKVEVYRFISTGNISFSQALRIGATQVDKQIMFYRQGYEKLRKTRSDGRNFLNVEGIDHILKMRDAGIEEVSSERVWKFGMIMVRKEKESNHR